jgi:C4-dicarboxylate-specific signal transduction histidine kinase
LFKEKHRHPRILLDITERKAYERVLQESKEQLEERVKERTAQFQAALDELGLFLFSFPRLAGSFASD